MKIKPISVWHNGANKQADEIDIRIVSDDLKTSAVFYYELRAEGVQVASGNVSVSGEEYDSWNAESDVNGSAVKLVVEKLGLELEEVS
jgi:hypothetical protein